ncbi:MAG: hypothetical protein DMF50_08485 [Acidobacteria bacterium]|nr:MAG: hypothetical protein DMF50_08485 [Acidobacteriota bacterium]
MLSAATDGSHRKSVPGTSTIWFCQVAPPSLEVPTPRLMRVPQFRQTATRFEGSTGLAAIPASA